MTPPVPELRGKKIAVVSMSSWGEAGNWLSGTSLRSTLSACLPETAVAMQSADSLVPCFTASGAAIKAITLRSRSPEERFARYEEVLKELHTLLPEGVEDRPEEHAGPSRELTALAGWAERGSFDLLIGTKGVICRALLAASRLAGVCPPVVNYVTNHAHFRFPVHRCPTAAMHLVRLPEAKHYVEDTCGWAPRTVRTIGYLVAAQLLLQQDLLAVPAAGRSPGRSVIVVSNRGGGEYLQLLRRLVPYGDAIDVTFIALNDEVLCRQAAREIQAAGISSWHAVRGLTQGELFRLMARAQTATMCALVCKASPNSIFEAAYFRLPMFLMRTGLPIEEWGADIVVREGIGHVEDDMDVLARRLVTYLDDPKSADGVRGKLETFAARYLRQDHTVHQLLEALRDVARSSHVQPTDH